MQISPDVVIMTKADLLAREAAAFRRGVERGKYEAAYNRKSQPATAEQMREFCHEINADARYLSPCPRGYDTVLGYLAKNYPERLAIMDQTADATMRDGWWLRGECLRQDIAPVKVKAPAFLREQGIEEVNAYPYALLHHRFSDE
jgi:hypothetical protein